MTYKDEDCDEDNDTEEDENEEGSDDDKMDESVNELSKLSSDDLLSKVEKQRAQGKITELMNPKKGFKFFIE